MNSQEQFRIGREFEQRFLARCSEFKCDRSALIPSGWRAFVRRRLGNTRLFVIFCYIETSGQFTLETGWLKDDGTFAGLSTNSPDEIQQALESGCAGDHRSFRIRIGYLMPHKADVLWSTRTTSGLGDSMEDMLRGEFDFGPPVIDPELASRSIDEAISALESYALPFLAAATRNLDGKTS